MKLNWLYKRGNGKKQHAESVGTAASAEEEVSKKLINQKYRAAESGDYVAESSPTDEEEEEEGEEEDCLLKLRYLKTVQLMLDRKTTYYAERESSGELSSTDDSKNQGTNEFVQKLQSSSTIGERLQSWYQSSSQSTDPSIELQPFVTQQSQEQCSNHYDPTNSVLGIAHFLDFSKFFDEGDEQDSTCDAKNSPSQFTIQN